MSETKFKPGDKVRVIKGSNSSQGYRMTPDTGMCWTIVGDMREQFGKEVTIKSIIPEGYFIEECSGYWTDEMFEEIVPEYYKCDGWLGNMFIDGKIYKTNDGQIKAENSDKAVYVSGYPHIFKPSTKAEFEAQFVPKYIKYVGETSDYRIKDRIYKVVSWKQGNVWVICNLDCGKSYNIYEAGASLCMDSLFYKSNEYTIVTEQEYLEQGKLSLQIGQWYRSKANSKLFIKSTGTCKYDVIWTVGGFESDYSSNNETLSSWTPLTDLSEIQEYLPDGHSDKKPILPKFEVGKWYKNLGEKQDYMGKFEKLIGNQWYCSDHIYKRIHQNYGGNLTSEFKFAVKCTSEEIQQYLPTNHPDRVKPKEWSVGTYAVVIKDDYLGYNHSLTHKPKMPIGFVGTIGYKYSDSTTAFEEDTYGTYVFQKDLVKWFATLSEAEAFAKELLTPKPFKLGPYDVIVDERGVKIGCTYLRKEQVVGFLEDFITISAKFNDVRGTITINGVVVTLTDADNLIRFINKH